MVRILNFTDNHAPLTHKPWWDWVLAQIEDFKPDWIVNTGDWLEGKPSKRFAHHSDETWSALDEIRALCEQAEAVNRVAPDAKKVWLWGNHDDNALGDLPERVPDDLKPLMNWRNIRGTEALEQWAIHETYSHEYRYRLGPIVFQHGCEVSKDGLRSLKDQAYQYGVPNGLHVSGHTHKPVPVTRCEERSISLPYWVVNAGTGADWERMHYMDRCSKQKWGRGCVLIETTEASVRDSKSAYAKPQWSAELRVHSMAREV